MHTTRRPLIVVLLLAGAVLGACGSDDGSRDRGDAQPAPGVTTFADGDFADIPLPPRAEPAGERSEQQGVVVQSFFVRDRTAEEVLQLYGTYFEGEGVATLLPPEPFGNDAWRGRWLLDGRELLVSAAPAPSVDDGEVEHADVVTQMSLELSPAG